MNHHAPQTPPLPEFLDEVAAVVGIELALKLAAEKGGTKIYLPARIDAKHWLCDMMGQEQAQALCEALRVGNLGQHYLVPMGTSAATATRWRRMHELIDKGLSKREIARACGVHMRTVQLHRNMRRDGRASLARVEAALAQLSLFD